MEDLAVHAKKKLPSKLLNAFRPNEPAEYKDYRLNRFQPFTYGDWCECRSVLSKFMYSQDFEIKFSQQTEYSNYVDNEHSIKLFYRDFLFNEKLADPNAICLVGFMVPGWPDKLPDNNRVKPEIYLFGSDEIIKYIPGVKLEAEHRTEEMYFANQIPDAKVRVIATTTQIDWFVEVGESGNYQVFSSYVHNIGKLPAFQLGGVLFQYKEKKKVFDSFLSGVLPAWNDAINLYSDQQVNEALHLHPEKWEIADNDCKVCKGSGIKGGTDPIKQIACGNCSGTGKVSLRTPFGVKVVKPVAKAGASDFTSMPMPPGGYFERPIETLDFTEKKIASLIKSGKRAVHMAILTETPEEQSGVAKVVDRQELFAYCEKVANDAVDNNLYPLYYYTFRYMYPDVTDENAINEALPTITLPDMFNVLGSEVQIDLLKTLKEASANPAITAAMECDIAEAQFGDESDDYRLVELINKLDPLPGKTTEAKTLEFSSKGCTWEDFIISCNIMPFVTRAMSEDANFYFLDLSKQMAKLSSYASEKMKEIQKNTVSIYDGQGVNNNAG
jgi:hypothetical protein